MRGTRIIHITLLLASLAVEVFGSSSDQGSSDSTSSAASKLKFSSADFQEVLQVDRLLEELVATSTWKPATKPTVDRGEEQSEEHQFGSAKSSLSDPTLSSPTLEPTAEPTAHPTHAVPFTQPSSEPSSTPSSEPPTAMCADGWLAYSYKCYFFLTALVTHDGCIFYCNAFHGGATSACIENAGQNDFIAQNKLPYDTMIGFFDAASQGTYQWVSACSSTYTNWRTGQPTDGIYNNWAIMTDGSGFWEAGDGGDQQAYSCVCEYIAGPTPSPTFAPSNPTFVPTLAPSAVPTVYPTDPTPEPTAEPTLMPTAAPTVAPSTFCADGWAEYGYKCYQFGSTVGMTAAACAAWCPTQRPEATILCIENADQNAFVTSASLGDTVLGLVRQSDDMWQQSPGCYTTYTNWSPGYPTSTTNNAILQTSGGTWWYIEDVGNYLCSCEYITAPTGSPTPLPSAQPSSAPSLLPTAVPTTQPSSRPSDQPTAVPTAEPTAHPAHAVPFTQPSSEPSSTPSSEPPTAMCADGWLAYSYKCYFFLTALVTHDGCIFYCNAFHGGATSACIENAGQNDFIAQNKLPYDTMIGFFDAASQGTYQWVSACSSTYTNWRTGQPTDGIYNNWAIMTDGSGFWEAGDGGDQQAYSCVCEYIAGPTPSPTFAPSNPTFVPTLAPSAVPTVYPTDPTPEPTAEPTLMPTAAPTVAPSTFCADGWAEYGYKCYQFGSTVGMTAAACAAWCPAQRPEATILCIENADQNAFVASASLGDTVLGLVRQSDDMWQQSPGCYTTYTNWSPGYPTSTTNNAILQTSGGTWWYIEDVGNYLCSCEYIAAPTGSPTPLPSAQPSSAPSLLPTAVPTTQPSSRPSDQPTAVPTGRPSGVPTAQPSARPSCRPSAQPSTQPTQEPSSHPSNQPSSIPSGRPSAQPTGQPSRNPSTQPSASPSVQPTSRPAVQPSSEPSSQPSAVPSKQPTACPTSRPSALPTQWPPSLPSTHPSHTPVILTRPPTAVPSAAPTMGPTKAGTQVYFNGSQVMNGLSAREFLDNVVVVEAWKATVALSCARNQSKLVRVDITSVDDVSARRMLVQGTDTTAPFVSFRSLSQDKYHALAKAAKVNFQVSYTQGDFNSTANMTTHMLKSNYEKSVSNHTFNTDFVAEVEKRTADSQVIVDTVQPSVVVLSNDYRVIQTTEMPSYRPTAVPSTGAPTLYWKASTVTSIVSNFTSGTISMNITFAPATVFPGTMYCTALPNNGTVTSTDQVVVSGTEVAYVIGTTNVAIQIMELNAITPYVTYCYTETAQGNGNTLSEVLATRRTHTTRCCKALDFTNAPASLYGDSSKYSTDQTERYVFAYVLGSAPMGLLVVQPQFGLIGAISVPDNVIAASPPFARFNPGSSDLTGSFIITINTAKFKTADYTLTLGLSGNSSHEYVALTTVVHVLANDAPPSPPALVSAVFSNSGGALFITFNSAFDQALSTVPCSTLFSFDGAFKATCTWTSNNAVRARFPAYDGSTPYAEPGQPLFLLANKIKAQCSSGTTCPSYLYSGAQQATIAGPVNPINPTVVVSMPHLAAFCANVTADASQSSGHGGRPWKSAVWTVSANVPGTSTTALQTKLNSIGTTLAQRIRFLVSAFARVGVQYTISLSLTNFLGRSSSASALFAVLDNPNLPIVQILGDTAFAVTPMSSVTIFASSGKSVCAERNVIFSTTWTVYSGSNNSVVNVVSTSVNPYVLILPAYSLSPGYRYHAVMTTSVTASATNAAISASADAYITVTSGSVVAMVSGGTNRLVLQNDGISIDASSSYDENVPRSTTGHLSFLWSCTYLTRAKYGSSCSNVLVSGTVRAAVVSLVASKLNTAETYSFKVQVAARDGRKASKTVTLRVQSPSSSTSVSIGAAPVKINANQRLVLTAQLTASYGLTGSWSASNGGSAVAIAASTPLSASFSASALASGAAFALLVPANQLSEGSTVTFRITADRTGYTDGIYQGFAEVSVVVNAPPTSGSFAATPQKGEALATTFDLAASGWTDDSTDLPLSYMFQFGSDSPSSALVIQSRQSASTVSAQLPVGSESSSYVVTLTATIYDNMLASTNATQGVTVLPVSSPDALETYMADKLNVFQATQDTSQATLLVNSIATSINVVNCTAANATFCSTLNRGPCSTEPGTCSSCLEGYVGVVGNSNAKCLSSTSTGMVGSTCRLNEGCQLGYCRDNMCAVPTKLCPSSTSNSTCSGNGECVYLDNTGKILDVACTIFDTQCFATCACANGTAGYDCLVTHAQLLELDAMRRTMCETFLDIAALSNPSFTLLETSIQTLSAAFDANQAATNSTVSVCSRALQSVTALAATDGFLADASTDTVTALVQLAAKYAQPANSSLGWDGFVLDASVANITSGVLQSMVNGQTDVTVATSTLKFVASKSKTADFSSLTAPLTSEEQAYGVMPTATLELIGSAGDACNAGKGYVDVALTQWGINPFPDVEALVAPQIKFESSVPALAAESNRLRELRKARPTSPAYFVTLVYNQPQNLTLDVLPGMKNLTFPECSVYDADTGQYKPCDGCQVSTYTNSKVTFVCYDITRLCGANATVVSASRRLGDSSRDGRELAATDDYLPDDDSSFGSQTSITSIQYSALATTFANVLSTNIFRINWRAAKVTISVVAVLVAIIIVGFLYFRTWDIHDHDLFLYKYKELPHLRLKKINQARSIRLKSKAAPPKKGNGFSLRQLNLRYMSRQESAFTRQQSTAAFDLWDAADVHEGDEELQNTVSRSNPMKSTDPYDSFNDNFDREQDQMTVEGTVDNYIRSAVPIRNLDGTPTDKLRTALDLLKHHPLFNLFFEANLQVSRVQRWTQICVEVLSGLFVDTLFFSTFYPSANECDSYSTEADCLVPQNNAVNMNMCYWKDNANVVEGGSCHPTSPPSDVMFMMILVMITLLITVPFSFVFDFVLTEYCSKRPDFDQWGYNTESLLGRSTQSLGEFAAEKLVSPIVALRREVDRSRAQLDSPVRFHSAAYLATSHPESDREKRILLDSEGEGRLMYHELIGLQEEVDEILRDAIKYLTITVRNQNVPWKTSVLHGSTAATALVLNEPKIRAIERYLGVASDGTPMRMSIYDYLRYGTQTKKLLSRIKRVRVEATQIRKTLDELGESELLSKDQALTQFFILEQFSLFKRYALRSSLFSFSVTSALPVDPMSWMLGWVFIVGCLVFFVYWMLAWGVNAADVTIQAWGINFAIATVQEIVLIQTFRIYVIYMISTIVIKPQLKAIYRTLQRLAIEYIQDELPDGFGVIKVVQHVSPACRVAKLKVSDSLAAGQILRQIDDSDVRSFHIASNLKVPLLLFTVIAIPVIASLLNDATGDITLNSVLPSAFSMIILGHVLLWQISPLALIMPYVALLLILLTGGILYERAEQRMQKMRAQAEARVGMKSLAGWQRRYRTNFNARMTNVESFQLYIRVQVTQYCNLGANFLAAIVYYVGQGDEVVDKFLELFGPQRPQSLCKRSWQTMNMPDYLHGRVISYHKLASTIKALNADRIEAPDLPDRVMRMTANVTDLWAEQGSPAPRMTADTTCGGGSRSYVRSLLSGEDHTLLGPAAMTEEQAAAPMGEVLLAAPSAQQLASGPVVARFKEKYGFCPTLDGAIRKVVKSFQQQLLTGSLYFLSLEDVQQLTSAVDLPDQDSSESPLVAFSGQVHVRDVALMLEEILYFYRPDHGHALSVHAVKDVLSRYDEWVVTAARPLDLELLDAARHLLKARSNSFDKDGFTGGDDEGASYSSIVERGHFQQHQLVAMIHFGKLAKEIKPQSPVTPYSRRTSIRRTRISCTWSDIRIVLDDEAKRLLELETGIMGAAMRNLGGRQKLSLASRMEAKEKQEEVRVHVAHATVAFDLFVAFLRSALAHQESPGEELFASEHDAPCPVSVESRDTSELTDAGESLSPPPLLLEIDNFPDVSEVYPAGPDNF